MVKFVKIFFIMLLPLSLSCHPPRDVCGEGVYKCTWAYDTNPYDHPVHIDADNVDVLFESGVLVRFLYGLGTPTEYNLKSICSANDIRGVDYYNWTTAYDNFSPPISVDRLLYDCNEYFIAVLAVNKCCKLDTNFNFLFDFADSGLNDSGIIDGVDIAVNERGEIFIADAGDNSVKIYNKEGVFINRWDNIGEISQIKIFDYTVYVLNRSIGQIYKFDYGGNQIGACLNEDFYHDIITFDPVRRGNIWIIDNNGSRLSLFNSGTISEVKIGYCLENTDFEFGNLKCIDGCLNYFLVVDYENNLILSFAELL